MALQMLKGRHVGKPGATWQVTWDARSRLSVHRMIALHREIEAELDRHFDAALTDAGLPARADWRISA